MTATTVREHAKSIRLGKFLKLLGLKRKPPGLKDFAKLGSDAGTVIAARTALGMTGTLTAAEAHRMVAEKQAAAANAYAAFVQHAFKGDLSSGAAASFAVFRQAVSSNKRRLRRRR